MRHPFRAHSERDRGQWFGPDGLPDRLRTSHRPARTGFEGTGFVNGDYLGAGYVQATLPTTPPVYQSRLAWVVVVQDLQIGSCPLGGASPTPRPTVAYQPGSDDVVIVIDAPTGGDALMYSPRQPTLCGATWRARL
jgi:hypothetical protein